MASIFRILLISRDQEFSVEFQKLITRGNFKLEISTNFYEELTLRKLGEYDIFVLEDDFISDNLIQTIDKNLSSSNPKPFIVFSNHLDPERIVKVVKAGASDYIHVDANQPEAGVQKLLHSVKKFVNSSFAEKAKEARTYKAIFENTRDGVYLFPVDKDTYEPGHFAVFNKVALRRLGYSEAELRGKTPADVTTKGNLKIKKVLGQIIRNGYSVYQSEHIAKNGQVIPVEINAKLINFDNKLHILAVVRNITRQKKVFDKLKKSHLRFQNVIENSLVGICIINEDGYMEYANPSFCSLLKYTKKEVLGRHFSMTLPEETREELMDSPKRFLNHEFYEPGIYNVIDKDQKTKHVFIDAIEILSYDDKPKMVAFINDFTETIHYERKLKLSEIKYRKMMEALHDPIFIKDRNCKIIFSNKAFKRRFGKVTGNDFCFNKIYGLSTSCTFCKKSNFSPSKRTRVLQKLNGRVYNIFERQIRINDDQEVRMTILRDVTKLIKAKEKAEEGDRLKSAFLANISHEIRTPLNAILGFSSLIKEIEFPKEEQEQYIDKINESGTDLLKVIDDIVEFSHVDSGLTKISKQNITIESLLEEIDQEVSRLQKKHSGKNLKFTINNQIPEDQSIISDYKRINKIIYHLIDNAFKFTEEGEITLHLKTDDHQWLQIRVSDTGIGFPKEKYELIFKRFRQLDEGATRNFGGNGLGLALVKHLTSLLGGDIKVESTPDQGSIFTVYLPQKLDS
ncbi:sensor histidine kinase, partial [Marinilabilia sp.]